MSKKKEEAKAMLSAAEDLGAVGVCPSSVTCGDSFSPEGRSQSGAAEDLGAEILRGAQDDESLVQGGEDTSSTADAVPLPLEGKANDGGAVEATAKVKLIVNKSMIVPEVKDGRVQLRAAYGGTVYSGSRREFGTGVFAELPAGYAGFMMPDKRLRENWGLLCMDVRKPCEEGEICVTLHNVGVRNCDIQPGQLIAEMLIVPCIEAEV